MSYDKKVLRIEEDILSGARPAGELLKQCVRRHRDDLLNGEVRNIYFSHEKGMEAIEFAEALNDYRGEPTKLFWWQRMELYYFFGWRREGGGRRFRTSYISMARKNQKTISRPPKIFYHLLMEGEYAAEAYISATKEEQAKICFDDVKTILENNPDLQGIFNSTSEKVYSLEYKSKIGFLTSNPKTADGTRPSYAQIDEYHEFDNDDMVAKLRTGMINRKEKILEIITTRGSDKTKPCYKNEQKIFLPVLRQQLIDDSTFVMIFAPDDDDDIYDPATWYKANPNLGVTFQEEDFREDLNRATNEGQESLNKFRTLNLNIWVDSLKTWIEDSTWMKGAGTVDIESLKGKACYGGLDMAMKDDFVAFVLTFPNDIEKNVGWRDKTEFTELYYFWIPRDTVRRRAQFGLHSINDWVLNGDVMLCDGNYVSHNEIRDKIIELSKMFDIQKVAFDPYNIGSIAEDCANENIEFVEFPQTMPNLTGPTKWFKELALDGRINHGGNPVMRWMVGNAVIITDTHENIRVTKDAKRRKEKVDGVIASIMAKGVYYYQSEAVTFRISGED